MLNNEFPPLGGGTATVNYFLFQEFAKYSDLSIDLITSSLTAQQYEEEQFSQQIRIYKVPVNNKNIHHSTALELIRYTVRGLRKAFELLQKKQYDLCFAFSGLPAGFMALSLLWSRKLPYVVSLQGPDIPGFEIRYKYLYPFLSPLIKVIWRNALTVLAISSKHRDLALSCDRQTEFKIIPNGLDTSSFPAREEPSSFEGIIIVCVARLIRRKGQDQLLRAFRLVRNNLPNLRIKLQLVGTGDFEKELRETHRSLALGDDVEFHGYVDRTQMPYIYQQAHIFALPSEHEGMSIALLEAMATGLPVVVTNVGGTAELVRHGRNGLIFEYGDVPQLARHLTTLVKNSSLRLEMRQANKAIISNFAWHTIAHQYYNLLKTLVPNKDIEQSLL